ncbi:MAG: YmfQ family protein, partial [Clostridiales bacterium]|nr:YmfQ family protein [Clostridiales bacterium]
MSRQAAWASRAGVFPARPAPDLDIIKSPEAERMRQMVTEGFYDRSRIALWMFEVIGREYDDMAVWARTLRNEAFPQTCTWSIAIWEFVYGFEPDDRLTLEYRRWRILSRMFTSLPINPARIESALSDLTGCPVEITENVDPYTFLVRVDESNIYNSGLSKYDLSEALKLLRDIKQSHLSFRYETYAQAPHMPSFVSVNGSMPITVMTTEMLEPELPPLAANVGI